MVAAAVVLSEQRTVLTHFLADVGVSGGEGLPDLRLILPRFDEWLTAQVVAKEDVAYLASRLGAYICLYLADHAGGSVSVASNRIFVSVKSAGGAPRELEPYALAWAWAGRPKIEFAASLLALVR